MLAYACAIRYRTTVAFHLVPCQGQGVRSGHPPEGPRPGIKASRARRLVVARPPSSNRPVEEHGESIRVFLAMIDPNMGYLEDD